MLTFGVKKKLLRIHGELKLSVPQSYCRQLPCKDMIKRTPGSIYDTTGEVTGFSGCYAV